MAAILKLKKVEQKSQDPNTFRSENQNLEYYRTVLKRESINSGWNIICGPGKARLARSIMRRNRGCPRAFGCPLTAAQTCTSAVT